DVRRRIIGQLSKGYRQRVGLADAIIGDPPLLILDEPTIGLDPNQIRQVRELIKNLGQNRTIILSTHILPEVEIICNRVIIINKGKIVAMDTLDGLARSVENQARINVEI
ncbi:MAG: AAA family ATPase, partial [Planctomycetota bacterium]